MFGSKPLSKFAPVNGKGFIKKDDTWINKGLSNVFEIFGKLFSKPF